MQENLLIWITIFTVLSPPGVLPGRLGPGAFARNLLLRRPRLVYAGQRQDDGLRSAPVPAAGNRPVHPRYRHNVFCLRFSHFPLRLRTFEKESIDPV